MLIWLERWVGEELGRGVRVQAEGQHVGGRLLLGGLTHGGELRGILKRVGDDLTAD
jgi:hypothetical protein